MLAIGAAYFSCSCAQSRKPDLTGENLMTRTRPTGHLAGICLISILTIFGMAACQPKNNNEEPKEGAAAFYDGRSIRWIIPYSPGGGYDEYLPSESGVSRACSCVQTLTGSRFRFAKATSIPDVGFARDRQRLCRAVPRGGSITR